MPGEELLKNFPINGRLDKFRENTIGKNRRV